MAVFPTTLIRARISRGGFANERTYTIRAASGSDFTGLASWQYCYNQNVQRSENEPPKEFEGFVEARIINGQPNGPAKVWLPDGEVCYVPRSELRTDIPIPPKSEVVPNVPV
jgi:hypothetical protein